MRWVEKRVADGVKLGKEAQELGLWGGGLRLDKEWGSQGPEDAGLQHSHPYPKSLGKMLQDSGARKHVGTYVLAKICGCHPGRGQEERRIPS